MSDKLKKLGQLFLTFAKIGAMTFGGGYAMIPILTREVAENKKWASEEELMDYYAIGQCTPGVIFVNTSTFVGYKLAGLAGSVVATIGGVTPSIVIITIIAEFIRNFADYAIVQHALAGIRVAVFVLILDAVIKLGKKSITDWGALLICAAVFLISLLTDISAVWLIIGAGVFGVILSNLLTKFGRKDKEEEP